MVLKNRQDKSAFGEIRRGEPAGSSRGSGSARLSSPKSESPPAKAGGLIASDPVPRKNGPRAKNQAGFLPPIARTEFRRVACEKKVSTWCDYSGPALASGASCGILLLPVSYSASAPGSRCTASLAALGRLSVFGAFVQLPFIWGIRSGRDGRPSRSSEPRRTLWRIQFNEKPARWPPGPAGRQEIRSLPIESGIRHYLDP